ncbi:metalloregulator ArsR/SmtB family transcription factor [Microbacterium sp. H1-D42]|uniref:ArsR/SmtB family transcription factor n=1 Tax=Microbacterium sp. H1-D42 TaxID=2925844 RepID=UPI001F53980D|nr:metalloregulator ArsR/SmtB family transcription factor [Microbacterium sp. H1-D42]UNK70092.1 metalloregulator ArsR/SmtB family transcription factor [Microbacterium sp. H1-D42]
MHEFEVLADAVRRRLVGLLALGEQPAGLLTDVVRTEFGISQPAVSQHLRVLRENGFATVRAEGTRRLYALDSSGVDAAARALAELTDPLGQRLDALHTEIARGQRAAAKGVVDESAIGTRSEGDTERNAS